MTVENCTSPPRPLRLFVRGAQSDLGAINPNEDYFEALIPSFPSGTGTVILSELATAGADQVRTIWIRARELNTSAAQGAVLSTKTATCTGTTTIQPFVAPELSFLGKRITNDLRQPVIGSPRGGDCLAADISNAFLLNRSPLTSYRALSHSKYVCADARADFTQTLMPCRGPDGRSTEDAMNRVELGPEQCSNTLIRSSLQEEGAGMYPVCCDVPERFLTSCSGFIVFEAKASDGTFRRLPEAHWSEFSMDIDVKNSVQLVPADAKIACDEFAARSNIAHVEATAGCATNCDVDNDNVYDPCDPLVQSVDSVAGGRTGMLRAATRNLAFTGIGGWLLPASLRCPGGIGNPDKACFTVADYDVLVGPQTQGFVSSTGETLEFDLPLQDDGVSPPSASEGPLTVKAVQDGVQHTATDAVDSRRLAFIGVPTVSVLSPGHVFPLDALTGDFRPIGTGVANFAPLVSNGAIMGIDVGGKRRKIVVSRASGVEVFDTSTGLRLGSDLLHPVHPRGRGVAVEDEVGGGYARYAYIAAARSANPSVIRVVDLDRVDGLGAPAPDFVSSGGATNFASIEGDALDIELLPVANDVVVYVTSVVEDGGSCDPGGSGFAGPLGGESLSGGNPIEPDPGEGGGGGIATRRRTLLSVVDMNRPAFSGAAPLQAAIELSCVTLPLTEPFTITEMGLAWNRDRSRLYIVVPDLNQVASFSKTATGVLDLISRVDIPVGRRPTDLVTARLKILGLAQDRAIVTSLGFPSGPGAQSPGFRHFRLDDPSDMSPLIELDPDSQPLSVSTHPDTSSATTSLVFIADQGRNEIRVIDLFSGVAQTIHRLPTSNSPARVTVQGQ